MLVEIEKSKTELFGTKHMTAEAQKYF